MADLKIDLSAYPERFAENSKELSISKKVNFIFGKNGTGKTTIAEEIKKQFSVDYNVCVFEDYQGVVGENYRLDAIALGTENTKIQKQIDEIDKEIAEIKKEIEEPENNSQNLFTRLEKAEKEYKKEETKLDNFHTKTAREIKNMTHPQIAKPTYDKQIFESEIIKAKLLSDEEIKRHTVTIKEEQKGVVSKVNFPETDLLIWLKLTNEVLQIKVSQQQIIAELQNNIEKQNFAKEGLQIHEHKNGEKCAFCGNEISNERWKLLGSYFNDEVKNLEKNIDDTILKINDKLSELDKVTDINKSDFYDSFIEQIELLNLQIKSVKNEYKTFLDELKTELENKKKNLFSVSKKLKLTIPQDFSKVGATYEKIVDKNNEFSQNLRQEQQNAKNALRFHEIKMALDDFKYDTENNELTILKTIQDEARKTLDNKEQELKKKKSIRNKLILQTKDENIIAEKISKLLKSMGITSFSLELVVGDNENQKGQYKIKGHNGNIRTITELSKGEKNIIAFLYFVFALAKPDDDIKPQIIVLDDPMTSNDDTMQYLMISQIQKLYKTIADNYFILLTHNCHFYLNARQPIDKFYEKYGNFHLYSDGKLTTIKKIKNGNDDFKTNYEMLWQQLIFLYQRDKPDLMLSSCRRICETYSKFNCIENFYSDNVGTKKLFDVNQHSIDDLEEEQNAMTREHIKNTLHELFKNNNAEEHFNHYWRD